ncbi:MAG: hypothetical protein SGBAC_006601 [Bacillariaceae sp.]
MIHLNFCVRLVDRSPGDILLQVPVEDTITTINSITSQNEYISLSQEQQLAMTLLHLRDQENHPYVSTQLPKDHYAIWNLPESIWDELKLPRCYRESFLATRQVVQKFASSSVDGRLLKDRMWAFSMVRSRCTAVPELEASSSSSSAANIKHESSTVPIALLPALDLFNHQFDAGTLLQLNGTAWTLTSSKSYSSGDQIYLSYGDEKDNWKLLMTYGFALADNPNALIFWTWQDLLEAAGKVRPSVFPARVQQSLLKHPQLHETYTVLSEQRATFSYDGKAKEPRESLVNGLQLLENLAVQLGQPNDASLGKDILEQLLENRANELKASIEAVQLTEGEAKKEWHSFLSSLILVLEEELKCILH